MSDGWVRLTFKQKMALFFARLFWLKIELRASDGTWVKVHPDFAQSYWKSPGLWQSALDSTANRENEILEKYRRL